MTKRIARPGTNTKQSINRLTKPGIRKGALSAAPDYTPQASAVRKSATFTPPISDATGGPVSPLTMIITATITRSIPVPPGATSVDVEDASAYTLTDANGVVYTVSSVSWPS